MALMVEAVTFTASDGGIWSPDYVIGLDGLGAAPAKLYAQEVPYRDGSVYLDTRIAPRILIVAFALVGTSREDFFAQRATTLQQLSPAKGPGTFSYTVPGVGPRVLTCAVEEGPRFSSQQRAGTLAIKDTVRFVAHDPAWYDPTPASAVFVGSGGGGVTFPLAFPITFGNSSLAGSQTATNAGDLATWPTITVVGPGSAPTITATYADGSQQTASFPALTLQAGDTLVIEHRPGRQAATLTPFGGQAANAIHLRSIASSFWGLAAGPTTVAAAMSGSSAQSSVTVQWYSRFSGI